MKLANAAALVVAALSNACATGVQDGSFETAENKSNQAFGEPIRSVRASSEIASIKEGALLHAESWRISPEEKLDVFVTNRFSGTEVVTFFTDIDSISLEVEPNKHYEFDVLLNGKKTRTQINTHTDREPSLARREIASYRRLNAGPDGLPDRIPFTIGSDSRLYIEGKVNDSEPIRILFDSGASSNVIATSMLGRGVEMQFDREVQNQGSDGVATVSVSDGNQFEAAGLVWKDMSFLSIDYQGEQLEGLLGWTAFENKIVEINYDEMALFIHESMDSVNLTKGRYSRSRMRILRGLPYIQGTIATLDGDATGWFEFDTGSDWTLSLSQKFAGEQGLGGAMEQIGTMSSSGSTGIVQKEIMVVAPELRLGDVELYQIPISIGESDPEGVSHNDIMGNRMLKRFNAVLDFKNLQVYLAPNQQMHMPYLDN